MEMAKRRIICVVGMHRSGTSMITRLLNMCGLELGPANRLLKPDKANPLGHFEHRGFLDLDRKLLKHFHATWYNPPDLPLKWEHDASVVPLLRQARALAASFPEGRPWGWKEPRACLFLPFWQLAIPGMKFLICLRSPLEVAKSLQTRNHMGIEHGAWLWYLYTLSALRDTQQRPRLLSFFDDYFDNRNQEISRVLAFCGLEDFNHITLLETAIAGDLRHHESGDQLLHDETVIPPECKKLYFGLRAIHGHKASPTDITEDSKGAAMSSAINDFAAEFTAQAAFRYFSGQQSVSVQSSQREQRMQKFLRTLRGASS